MRNLLPCIAALCAAVLLAGCSTNLLTGKSHVQQASNVPVGSSLTMPPDLSLAAPGQTSDAYVSNAPPPVTTQPQQMASADDTQLYGAGSGTTGLAPPQQDVYQKYNISKTKPDGTPKKDWELRAELKQAMLAEKKRANPSYGTIMNIGDLFKDN